MNFVNFRVMAVASCLEISLQAFAGMLIGSLEFIGFLPLERALLGRISAIYSPAIALFHIITPSRWQTLGNVCYGFLTVIFAVIIYGIGIGIVFGIAGNRKGGHH